MDHYVKHNADVRRTKRIRTDTVCFDELRFDLKAFHRLDNRVAPFRVTDSSNYSMFFRKSNYGTALFNTCRQWFLDHNGDIVFDKLDSQIVMMDRRCRNSNRIHLAYEIVAIRKGLAPILFSQRIGFALVNVYHADKFAFGKLAVYFRMDTAHFAGTDDCCSDLTCHVSPQNNILISLVRRTKP